MKIPKGDENVLYLTRRKMYLDHVPLYIYIKKISGAVPDEYL